LTKESNGELVQLKRNATEGGVQLPLFIGCRPVTMKIDSDLVLQKHVKRVIL